jgi:Ca2+-binding EF-hand superfamily protein
LLTLLCSVGGGGGGGAGVGKLMVTGVVSWLLGAKVHSGRVAKKLKARHQREQKQLYSQYYNDVYKLSEQNQALANHAEELKDLVRSTEAKSELEALQRDYDEFKQPDIDGDDRISRAEFNMYVKNYLSSYPGLAEKDYPHFDDFDHDGDGFVSFQEYSQQMALQAQQAELEQMYSPDGDQKAQAYTALYEATSGGTKGGAQKGGGQQRLYG